MSQYVPFNSPPFEPWYQVHSCSYGNALSKPALQIQLRRFWPSGDCLDLNFLLLRWSFSFQLWSPPDPFIPGHLNDTCWIYGLVLVNSWYAPSTITMLSLNFPVGSIKSSLMRIQSYWQNPLKHLIESGRLFGSYKWIKTILRTSNWTTNCKQI